MEKQFREVLIRKNTMVLIQQISFENSVCKMLAISYFETIHRKFALSAI